MALDRLIDFAIRTERPREAVRSAAPAELGMVADVADVTKPCEDLFKGWDLR